MGIPARPGHSMPSILARLAVCALVGLLILPTLFDGRDTPILSVPLPVSAIAWLALAGAVVLWLAIEARSLGSALARSSDILVARATGWAVALGATAIAQAILRRPFVRVVGAGGDPSASDAAFAAVVLLLLAAMLIPLQRAAAPVITASARRSLDALLPTVDSDEPAPAPAAFGPRRADAPEPLAATVAAVSTAATVAAVVAASTIESADPAEATIVSPREPSASGDDLAETIGGETIGGETIARRPGDATLPRSVSETGRGGPTNV